MKSTQKSGRARGRGQRKSNGNVLNRVYDSSGPEGKVRGTPQQIMDKYLTLARDAQTAGDRVMSENFLQHAEHYSRILIQATASQQEKRDGSDGDGDQPSAGQQAQKGQEGPRRGHGEGNGADTPSQQAGETGADANGDRPVSGLTTIDSEAGEQADAPLLVGVDESGAEAQPAKRRRTRKADAAEGEGEAKPRAQRNRRLPKDEAEQPAESAANEPAQTEARASSENG